MMTKNDTASLAGRLTATWGHVVGGIAGGFFFIGGVLFFGTGVWIPLCRLDWSCPDWTKIGILLMGPILIGATLLWAACATYKTVRNYFRTQQKEQEEVSQQPHRIRSPLRGLLNGELDRSAREND
jgi:hypothetical protein